MPKQKTLFTIKNKNNQMNMNVDETLYNHFRSLRPNRRCARFGRIAESRGPAPRDSTNPVAERPGLGSGD